ncbi:collagen alpha-1(XXV) chain-like [Ahaetulla prasina]|uniref:collagen alpha-1(XXV) chain-like n=1 Tax=Ahaetulla prasina TaxID=499056 RepID=UPI002648B0C6|nr:collagen alpha-1(XXV) chain-like [Ahaetulla prasina]
MVGKRNPDAKGEAGCFGGQGFCSVRSAPPFNSLLAAFLLSVGSIASCVYLGMKTNDLQARVFAIEAAQGDMGAAAAAAVAGSYRALPSYSLDQLNSLMQEKVEQLLAQKTYEHMAKIRTVREASSECNCPPGFLFSSNLFHQ